MSEVIPVAWERARERGKERERETHTEKRERERERERENRIGYCHLCSQLESLKLATHTATKKEKLTNTKNV